MPITALSHNLLQFTLKYDIKPCLHLIFDGLQRYIKGCDVRAECSKETERIGNAISEGGGDYLAVK